MNTNPTEHPDEWILRLKAGDEAAVEQLVEVYYDRLVRFARRRLAGMPQQVADDEGAVISAMRSFFSCVEGGQFSRISNDDDLWRILATLTARKAIRQMRVFWKQSGEGGNAKTELDLEQLVSREPSPELESQMAEEFQQRFDSLDDDTLKEIVLMKLEGCENAEIATRLSIHIRSVQRKLKRVEAIWLVDGP